MVASLGIQTAELDWECVDGIDIPVSKQFGDVYFSKANGLLETRHVFLEGNDLTTRLSQLEPYASFCVGETGFGTGLNILTLWQLWQKVRPNNHSHLHVMSVEKYPLSKLDLIRALNAWSELAPLAQQLIEQYPSPIAGCHRLSFPDERFSIDLWLGDAHDVFPIMKKIAPVNAWFLDGFAPSCNPELWQEHVLNHIVRLSDVGTTFSSFSVAGVLKRGLKAHGIDISRPKGFGHKREMLKAIWQAPTLNEADQIITSNVCSKPQHTQQNIAVIGAGIAGLSMAWSLAQRGHQITIYEQTSSLSGASGNPLALLNPKLSPITQTTEHLMTLAWQHALRYYPQFEAFQAIQVNQIDIKHPEKLAALAQQYPEDLLSFQSASQSQIETEYASLKLIHAGTVQPHLLRDQILSHPQITLVSACVTGLVENSKSVDVMQHTDCLMQADHVVVCAAKNSQSLFAQYPVLKPIRGQVSWCEQPTQVSLNQQAYSYGGYCAPINNQQMIFGASFYPKRDDVEVLEADHQHNFELMHSVFPKLANVLPPVQTWQGRASIRAQTADYLPLVGQIEQDSKIFTLAGLGSKGFLFAPLCSEIIASLLLKEVCPVPEPLLSKLNPQRFFKKVKPRKPYFTQPNQL